MRLPPFPSSPYTRADLLAGYELVTPPLDGMILPGVTRDSVLTLARDHLAGTTRVAGLPPKLTVSERPVTMQEVKDAAQAGKVVEMFGAGAPFISAILEHHADNLQSQAPPPSSAPLTALAISARTSSSPRARAAWAPSRAPSGPNWSAARRAPSPMSGALLFDWPQSAHSD